MTKEQFDREMHYGASMAIARTLLRSDIISAKEYRKIDTIFRKKYRPIIGAPISINP